MIGVDLSGSETEWLPVLTVLRQQLEINRLVMLEPWDNKKRFNFIISSVYNQIYDLPVYYLKGAPNPFDIRQLKDKVNDYLADNNK